MKFQKFPIFHLWVCVTDSPRCRVWVTDTCWDLFEDKKVKLTHSRKSQAAPICLKMKMSWFTLHVHVYFYVLLSLPLLLLLPNLHTASMTRHSTVTVTETQDVTMYYWRQRMSRISGLSLYMCLYWLLCYDCGGCRLLAAAQSPSTPVSAPRMRTADRILSRPAVSSRRRCGCKHWHSLRHVHTPRRVSNMFKHLSGDKYCNLYLTKMQ